MMTVYGNFEEGRKKRVGGGRVSDYSQNVTPYLAGRVHVLTISTSQRSLRSLRRVRPKGKGVSRGREKIIVGRFLFAIPVFEKMCTIILKFQC